jgi:hypothetical protein
MAWPTDLDAFPSPAFPNAATLHGHKLSGDAHSTLHAALGSRVVDIEGRIGVPAAPAVGSIFDRIAKLEAQLAAAADGWVPEVGEAWQRVSDTQLTVHGASSAGRVADFGLGAGVKLRWKDDGGVKYGVVLNSSVAAAVAPATGYVTTVNIIPNDDFKVGIGIASFVANAALSRMERPVGFPGMFACAPTLTTSGTAGAQQGSRGSTQVLTGRWWVAGKFLIYEFSIIWGGSGIAQGTGNYRVSVPCATKSLGPTPYNGVGHATIRSGGAGAGNLFPGSCSINSGNAYMNINSVGAGWLSTVTCAANVPNTWVAGDFIQGTAILPLA